MGKTMLAKDEIPDNFEMNNELKDILKSVRCLRIRYSQLAANQPVLSNNPNTIKQFDGLEEHLFSDCFSLLIRELKITTD